LRADGERPLGQVSWLADQAPAAAFPGLSSPSGSVAARYRSQLRDSAGFAPASLRPGGHFEW